MDPPDPLVPNGWLNAVSCAGDTCMAVGGSSFANGQGTPSAQIRGSDGRWTLLPVPAPAVRDDAILLGVSCPAPGMCVAVGTVVVDRTRLEPLAEQWDGQRWLLMALPTGITGSLASLSCPTTTMCMAVGQQGPAASGAALAFRWDGRSWSLTTTPPPTPTPYNFSFTGVSCGSATSCLAIGSMSSSSGRIVLAETWDGLGWSVLELPWAVTDLQAVSCPSTLSCMAMGRGGNFPSIGPIGLQWDGTTWTMQAITAPADLPLGLFAAVSCPSPTDCRAIGAAGKPAPSLEVQLVAAAWDGHNWTIERLPTPANTQSALRGISCPSAGTCTTVGGFHPIDPHSPNGPLGRTFAERRTGGAWTVETTPDPVGPSGSALTDVSCPPGGPCMAVGAFIDQDGYNLLQSQTWDGTVWTPQPIATPDGDSPRLNAVSCATAVSCTAVGTLYRGDFPALYAERWDGQRWSLQSVPIPLGSDYGELLDVSCPSALTCLAVGRVATGTNSAHAFVARWNGLAWSAETVVLPYHGSQDGLSAVSCPTVASCIAIGNATTDAGDVTFAVRWTADRMDVEAVAPASFVNGLFLDAISCSTDDECMAIGRSYGSMTAMHRSNAGWTNEPVARPTPDTAADLLDVSCLAGACVAVGSYEPPTANHDHPVVETWDGRTWTVQPIANEDPVQGRLHGVSCAASCVAVGNTFNTLAVIGPAPLPDPTTATTVPVTTIPTNLVVANAAQGYWALASDGRVYNFGAAPALGNGAAGAADIEPTPTGKGYWILDHNGTVRAFGDAGKLGDLVAAKLVNGEEPASLSATPSGRGYWIFTNRGRVFAFGDAPLLGDMSQTKLNGPVLGSVATPSGKGYYMVASDGGIFAFGDAAFSGSMGGKKLNAPVQSLVPDGDGHGYWLVASDGGIFAFDAPFRGSMGATKLNKSISGMVRYGDGYLMVGADGGIFNFSTAPFAGSLGDKPPATPVVAVTAVPT